MILDKWALAACWLLEEASDTSFAGAGAGTAAGTARAPAMRLATIGARKRIFAEFVVVG